MWRDGEADRRRGAGVHPWCRHQLPHAFQKLSRGRLQNHPGETHELEHSTYGASNRSLSPRAFTSPVQKVHYEWKDLILTRGQSSRAEPNGNNVVLTVLFCVQKERKLLQVKRLDLDAAKTRLKKARMADARAAVSVPLVPRPVGSGAELKSRVGLLLAERSSSCSFFWACPAVPHRKP